MHVVRADALDARDVRPAAGRGAPRRGTPATRCRLRSGVVASALVGASSVEQLDDNLAALDNLDFSADELAEIDRFAVDGGVNLWAPSSNA